ncbi:methylated-DNA--[protein]-cysteine S-methyltransferase [Halorarum salinum]|uniref:methylated-DNA--[protein]-cysteine S-methyltransferase n=1 Tax=Halorarum salinum TaxID=2743089 RepID=A0A7D5QHU5_9EURY|nr:methylated-DNA--[protein]-cysteine S-methyltransferase [Halobaculum salinum]QLG62464.1 methylated-DNA--[protein]-cysteine S-methyltransferase [Halobaculum salinum]
MDEPFTVPTPGGTLTLDATWVAATPGEVREQAAEYDSGERTTFDVGVRYPDSFTGEVMRAMAAIPYGETRTYGDLADRLGTSPVAVGGACGRNPVPLVVPCHRVVGADGLRGFSGDGGVDQKRALLAHEGALPDAAESADGRDGTTRQLTLPDVE